MKCLKAWFIEKFDDDALLKSHFFFFLLNLIFSWQVNVSHCI